MNREEQGIQIAVFEWAKWMEKQHPPLELMHHIPNGGKRSKAEAAIFKAMGVKSGVPDIFLPEPRGAYHGLYIELKSRSGKPSQDQTDMLERLQSAGYLACICDSFEKAIKIIGKYLSLPKINMTYMLIDEYGEKFCDECKIEL